MVEIVIVVGVVLLAAAVVVGGLRRTAAGKDGCAGCCGCSRSAHCDDGPKIPENGSRRSG